MLRNGGKPLACAGEKAVILSVPLSSEQCLLLPLQPLQPRGEAGRPPPLQPTQVWYADAPANFPLAVHGFLKYL